MRRRRYSKEQKAQLVARWAESGLSRAVYARRHRVSAVSLAKWEAELGAEDGGQEPLRFVEVDVAGRSAGEGRAMDQRISLVAEVVLPGGARMRFFSREDAC